MIQTKTEITRVVKARGKVQETSIIVTEIKDFKIIPKRNVIILNLMDYSVEEGNVLKIISSDIYEVSKEQFDGAIALLGNPDSFDSLTEKFYLALLNDYNTDCPYTDVTNNWELRP